MLKHLDIRGITIGLLLMVICTPSLADETYQYERLWPVLLQPWYFAKPNGIAIDNNGNIYVADTDNNRVQKFTADGFFIGSLRTCANENDTLNKPEGVALDADGNVFIADTGNSRIVLFNANGQFIKSLTGSSNSVYGKFGYITGIAIDSHRNIYAIDNGNYFVEKLTVDGQSLQIWGGTGSDNGQFKKPYGIALDHNGYAYISDTENHRIQKFDSDGNYISQWNSGGGDNPKLNYPYGVAVDKNNNVYVSESINYRIQKFSSEGVYINQWGTRGRGDGQFDSPHGITVDKNNNIYVADTNNNRIQKFSPDLGFITKLSSAGSSNGRFSFPSGITIDSVGDVYVVDSGNNRIQKFSPDGQFLGKWGSKGAGDGQFIFSDVLVSNPKICIDYENNIYVADTGNNRIQKFSPDGQFLGKWGKVDANGNPQSGSGDGEFYGPFGIETDSLGNIYVSEIYINNRIQKFNPDFQFITKWGSVGSGAGQFKSPYGIGIDSADNIFVADYANHRVQKFTASGSPISTKWLNPDGSDAQFFKVFDVKADASGNVFVADRSVNQIRKFRPVDNGSGGFNYELCSAVGDNGSDPGQTYQPCGIAIGPSDKIYVADTYNNRIQVFKKVTESFNSKAIIVAGGGPFEGNNLWDTTRMCANFAYRTLTYQGFNKNTIQYLSADTSTDLDGDGQPDVDADATNDNLFSAITSLANSGDTIGDVILYLVDHGGDNTFRMGGRETLFAAELASRLAALQGKFTGNLIVIYDACESGTFKDVLAGDRRIIITSTAAGESAHFITQGSLSFSNLFWNQVLMGSDIATAFNLSKEAISFITAFQTPQIAPDPSINLSQTFIGTHVQNQGAGPQIGNVSAAFIDPASPSIGRIHADGVTDPDGIARVWAVIRPPDYRQGDTEKSILELPSVELAQTEDIGVYEGTWNGFTSLTTTSPGTYIISVYARDRVGNTSTPELTSLSIQNPRYRRAIIVAGGTEGEPLPPAIEKSVKQAWDALTFQGYTTDTIYLMSPFSVAGVPQIPVPPAQAALEFAFTIWSKNQTQDLVVYLVGSGDTEIFNTYTHEVTEGDTTRTVTETLTAEQLGNWLNALQLGEDSIPGTVTVIYDAPKAASFLPLLIPPTGKQRISIASSGCTQGAFFLTEDNFSFSRFFWEQVLNGVNVWDAFTQADRGLFFLQAKHPQSYACMGQTPFLDDSGNGVGNESADGKLAKNHTLGFGIMRGADEPIIGEVTSQVSPPETINGETFITITVQAGNITATCDITGVWATIIPPDYCAAAGSEPPTIELLDDNNDKTWEGSYTYPVDPKVTVSGTFRVTAHATDSCDKNALPKDTTVYQPIGPDIYEDDDVPERASVIVLNDRTPQEHNFHDAGDLDYVKFYGATGQVYTITISDIGPLCDPVVDIINGKTLREIASKELKGAGYIDWTCPAYGLYYLRIRERGSVVHGAGTQYYLKLTQPIGPDGLIWGTVRDGLTGGMIAAAQITSNAAQVAYSDRNGEYSMVHPEANSFMLTVEKPGYGTQVKPVQDFNPGDELQLDFVLTPIMRTTSTTTVKTTTSTTTTTSVPGVITTTTSISSTTTPTGNNPCAMEQLFSKDKEQPVLERLRQFRDQKLSRTIMGRILISLYYNHTEELNAIFTSNAALAAQAKQLITQLLPEAEKSLSASPLLLLHTGQAAAASGLLRELQRSASPSLKRTLHFVSRKLVKR